MGTLLISILAAIGFLFVGWWIGGKLKEVKLSKKIDMAKDLVESIGDKMGEEASEVIDKVKKLMK